MTAQLAQITKITYSVYINDVWTEYSTTYPCFRENICNANVVRVDAVEHQWGEYSTGFACFYNFGGNPSSGSYTQSIKALENEAFSLLPSKEDSKYYFLCLSNRPISKYFDERQVKIQYA